MPGGHSRRRLCSGIVTDVANRAVVEGLHQQQACRQSWTQPPLCGTGVRRQDTKTCTIAGPGSSGRTAEVGGARAQHPEHGKLYLEDAFTSHHISAESLDILLETAFQNLPSGAQARSVGTASDSWSVGPSSRRAARHGTPCADVRVHAGVHQAGVGLT